jgi:hypothetical protein
MADEIRDEDFASLANKLEGLDLTSSEKMLLNAIIENANDDSDVAGYSYDNAAWLINANITAPRVQVASKFLPGSIGTTKQGGEI